MDTAKSTHRPLNEDWNACAVPWKVVLKVAGRISRYEPGQIHHAIQATPQVHDPTEPGVRIGHMLQIADRENLARLRQRQQVVAARRADGQPRNGKAFIPGCLQPARKARLEFPDCFAVGHGVRAGQPSALILASSSAGSTGLVT